MMCGRQLFTVGLSLIMSQQVVGATLSMKGGQFDFHFTKAECDYLTVNTPTSPDVAYQGDVDADGNTLASVEVSSDLHVKVPDRISIPLNPIINGSPFFGNSHNDFLDKAQMGNVQVDVKSGRIWYNNQPLFDVNQEIVDAYCKRLNAP